jgi:hypothetical protein
VTHDEKQRKLVFSHLPHSALKFDSALITQRNVRIRSQMNCGLWYSALRLPAECHTSSGSALKLTAECHRPRRRFRPAVFRFQRYCGMRQSAFHIWARNVAFEWNPAPAILHRESHCLKRHTGIFLTRDLQCVLYRYIPTHTADCIYYTPMVASWYTFVVTLCL